MEHLINGVCRLTTDALIEIAKNHGLTSLQTDIRREGETLVSVDIFAQNLSGESTRTITRAEIDKERARSSVNSKLWDSHFEEMVRKFAIRIFLREYLTLSVVKV